MLRSGINGGGPVKEAFAREVTIGEGGVVRIESPELPTGARAFVIVIVEEAASPQPPLSQLMGRSAPSFRSAAHVDEFIRKERDSWTSSRG
jgi:hypothetical protein